MTQFEAEMQALRQRSSRMSNDIVIMTSDERTKLIQGTDDMVNFCESIKENTQVNTIAIISSASLYYILGR